MEKVTKRKENVIMGMAAGQARLLSITSRMSDNELRAQIINNNKMRLASESSQVSESYVAALNEAQLMFANYDADNNATYQQLSFNSLTAYNPYNNHYALINNSGNVLLSESDAQHYINSGGSLDKFLQEYGLEKTTTYFNNLATLDENGQGIEKDGVNTVLIPGVDANGNICSISSGFTAEELKNMYLGKGTVSMLGNDNIKPNGYITTLNSDDFYQYSSLLEKLITNNENYKSLAKTAALDELDKIAQTIDTVTGSGKKYTSLKDIINEFNSNSSDINKAIEVAGDLQAVVDSAYTYSDRSKTINNCLLQLAQILKNATIYNNSNNINETTVSYRNLENKSSDQSDPKKDELEYLISSFPVRALNADAIFVTDGTDIYLAVGDICEGKSESYDLAFKIDTSTKEFYAATYTTVDDKDYISFDTTATPTTNNINFSELTTTHEDDVLFEETFSGGTKQFYKIRELTVSENDSENDGEDDSEHIDITTETTFELLQKAVQFVFEYLRTNIVALWAKEDSTADPWYIAYGTEAYNAKQAKDDANKAILKLIFDDEYYENLDMTEHIDNMPRFYEEHGQDFTDDFRQVYMNIILDTIMDTYGEPKVTWIDTSAPRDSYNENGEAKALWYENLFNRIQTGGYKVLQDGLASSPEWIQFAFESGIVTMEQVDTYNNWNPLIYSNCSDITSQTNDQMIAKAEAEYNAAMNKIENKDKRYDLELKNIDTEHNSLQIEYESIKKAIDKNIERNFKLYS